MVINVSDNWEGHLLQYLAATSRKFKAGSHEQHTSNNTARAALYQHKSIDLSMRAGSYTLRHRGLEVGGAAFDLVSVHLHLRLHSFR